MIQLKLSKVYSCFMVGVFLVAFLSVIGLSQADTVTVAVGGDPMDLVMTPDGKYVYVATGKNVVVIDTSTNKLLTSIKTGGISEGVAVTSDGQYVYVANREPPTPPGASASRGSVSIISTVTNAVTSTMVVGADPRAVVIAPNGEYAYVLVNEFVAEGSLLNTFGVVSVVSTATAEVVATVTVGKESGALAITPNGEYVYVTNGDGTISVLDTASNIVTAKITVGQVNFSGLAFTPDGKYIYISTGLDGVLVMSTESNAVTTTITGDFVGLNGVAVAPDGKYAYVTCGLRNNLILVINTATNVVEYTLSGGVRPYGIVIAPNGQYAYVTNLVSTIEKNSFESTSAGTVVVISTAKNVGVSDSSDSDGGVSDSSDSDGGVSGFSFVFDSFYLLLITCVLVVVALLGMVVFFVRRGRKRGVGSAGLGVGTSGGLAEICLSNLSGCCFCF